MKRVMWGLALAGAAAAAQAYDFGSLLNQAVDTAKQVTQDNSAGEEDRVGRSTAATLLGAAPLWSNGAAQDYVNRVGSWVAAHSERPGLSWRFGILDSATINAFAAPGGYVFVTRGLLAKIANEGELAGVLGHEIAHVQEQHQFRAIRQQHLTGALTSMVGAQTSASASVAGQELVHIDARSLYANALSKSDEYDADRIGVVLAARSGYDPYGLPAVLQTLDNMKQDDLALALLFKTHPRPGDRLKQLDSFLSARSDLETIRGRPDGQARFAAAMGIAPAKRAGK